MSESTPDTDVELWSYPVNINQLGNSEHNYSLCANQDELEVLARVVSLSEIRLLSGKIQLQKTSGGAELSGQIRAEIVQPCSLSLEPVVQTIDEPLKHTIIRKKSRQADDFEADEALFIEYGNVDEDDEIEASENGIVDLAALVVEQMIIFIDPYPRSKNLDEAELKPFLTSEEDAKAQSSPFAALSKLKDG